MKFYDLVEKLNGLLLDFKRNKKYRLNPDEVGINLGCENNTIPGYAGIDGSPLLWMNTNKLFPTFLRRKLFSKTCTANHLSFKEFMAKQKSIGIMHHNLLYGIPFKSNSIENIFTSHFIEHLTREQAIKLLKDCHRALKKGGVIRIIIPDLNEEILEMQKTIKRYKRDNSVEPLQKYLTVDTHNHNSFSFHRRMYNFEELKKILNLAGFTKITRQKKFKGKLKFVKTLDQRDGLIVEAQK